MKQPEVFVLIFVAVIVVWFAPTKIVAPIAEVGGLAFLTAIILDWLRQYSFSKNTKKPIDNKF